MAIFRWGSALEAFRDLEREMDRWIRHLDMAVGSRLGRPFPHLNLYELPDEFLLVGELSGVNLEDLEISVATGQLLIQGERRNVDIPDDKIRRSERPQGRWERAIQLPPRVDEDSIRAELTNGILKLHLPKIPQSEPRRINILDVAKPAGGDA
jgi:HSP20 family protein